MAQVLVQLEASVFDPAGVAQSSGYLDKTPSERRDEMDALSEHARRNASCGGGNPAGAVDGSRMVTAPTWNGLVGDSSVMNMESRPLSRRTGVTPEVQCPPMHSPTPTFCAPRAADEKRHGRRILWEVRRQCNHSHTGQGRTAAAPCRQRNVVGRAPAAEALEAVGSAHRTRSMLPSSTGSRDPGSTSPNSWRAPSDGLGHHRSRSRRGHDDAGRRDDRQCDGHIRPVRAAVKRQQGVRLGR